MNARQRKAQRIMTEGGVSRGHGCFHVKSQSEGGYHRVTVQGLFPSCSCKDFELTGQPCKHQMAVDLFLKAEANPVPAPTEPVPEVKRKTYAQKWPEYTKAQCHEKRHVCDLLAALAAGVPDPTMTAKRGRGRPAVPLCDQIFSVVFKQWCGLSARRFMCDLTDAVERGHMTAKICHNSVLAALESETLTPILKELVRVSALPLASAETRFAVDSTSLATLRYERYFDVKHGGARTKADWVKLHACVGVTTNCITALEALEANSNDCNVLPPLVNDTAKGFRVEEVSADRAYASQKNFTAVDGVGGTLYAAFKNNTKAHDGGLFAKAYHHFCANREEYLQHYHLRSNAESCFSALKRKFSTFLRSKTDAALRNESYALVIAYNLSCLVHAIYELGITPTFWKDDRGDESQSILKFG
jgi:hypothetical protein